VYSTFLGGISTDGGGPIAVDSTGSIYVAGYTMSYDFPTQNPIQGSKAGNYDAFITKINASGTALVYSTYLGGSGEDGRCPLGIAVDSEGAAYLAGCTLSNDFPTQNPIQGTNAGGYDASIAKINASGTALVYSTYLGGSDAEYGGHIEVDSEGAVYVAGGTGSIDFPTKNPIQENKAGGDDDAFITKINASGTALVYSTYLGGSDADGAVGIAVDSEGAAYVAVQTESTNLPVKNPIQETNAGDIDIFIAKVNSSGSALIYSTYLGGSGSDISNGIAVDSEGAAYVTGWTVFSDFPTKNPIQGSYGGGSRDFYIAKLYFNPYSTPCLIIAAGSGGTTDPSPGTYTYDEGTEVAIRAIPNSGYTFSGWSGDASGTTNPITITMDSDKSITASFTAVSTGDGDGDGKKGGCFIATAAYDSPLHPHVKILRDFRDKYLMPDKLGRVLVNLYYKYSPFVADLIAKHKILKIAVRFSLLPVIAFSYSMVNIGPIITVVLPVFIFALPIFLISFFRRKLSQVEPKSFKALASLD